MDASPVLVSSIYALSLAGSLVLGYVVWSNREKTGARPLLGSIVGGAWWTAALLLATLSSNYVLSMWLERALYVGVVIVVASVFLLGLEYAGREHLITWPVIAALSIHPVLVVSLALVNPGNVFFASLSPDPAMPTGVEVEWGIGFWLHSLYSYALVLVTVVLVVRMLFRTKSLYRGQILALLLALSSPAVGNLLWTVGPVSFDSTPVGFVVANALFTVAITRYRLIQITPIAHSRVIDTITDAVFVVDADGRLTEMNPAGREMAAKHLDDERLVGRPATELLEPIPEARELYHGVVAGDSERQTELSVSGRHYDVTASPVTDDRDRRHGWLFLVTDVTERVRRERELRRRNEQLDQFARVVSHDLRNPIAVAEGYADLARETGDVAHVDNVTDALDRMEAIVDDVLTLARDESDAIEVTPVDLESVATDAWETVDTGAATLAVDGSVTLRADRARLSRLLENLFRNAVEHGTASGDGRRDGEDSPLQVAVGVLERDGGRPGGFYVADDGRGIPDAQGDAVFEMGHTTSDDGTGFGLSIVQQIADLHEWEVRLTESDAGGVRVEITGVEAVGERPDPSRPSAERDPGA